MIVHIRFNGDLNELVADDGKGEWRAVTFPGKRSAKDLIQALGVPHTEIGKILVNERGIDFDQILDHEDSVDVYPVNPVYSVYPPQPGEPRDYPVPPRFICDVHLWKLARRLRLLGFDTRFNPEWDDPQLADICREEHLLLLSRDRGLLKRNKVRHGLLIRNTDPEKQVEEVLVRLGVASYAEPFSRCLICNSLLENVYASGEVFESHIKPNVPAKILDWCREFHLCPSCRRVFWKGSHYKKLSRMIEKYLTAKDG